MKQFIVQQNEAGQRLDKLLAKILNKAPKSFIYKMLRKKNITLNGKKADGSEKLSVSDDIKLFLSDETIAQFNEQEQVEELNATDAEFKLDVIYEDRHILVVNKPVGVLSQRAEKEDVSMVEYIISYLLKTKQITREQLASFKPSVCNRLDRNTGGILIAGKSLLGLQEMARLLKERSLNKYYLCIVKGKVEGKKRIEGFLSKDEDKNQVTIYQEQKDNTEYICTEYEPISYSKYALMNEAAVREDAYLRNLKKVSSDNVVLMNLDKKASSDNAVPGDSDKKASSDSTVSVDSDKKVSFDNAVPGDSDKKASSDSTVSVDSDKKVSFDNAVPGDSDKKASSDNAVSGNLDKKASSDNAVSMNSEKKVSSENMVAQNSDMQGEETVGLYTLLQVKLITGRSHQIRAHLASIGHPVIGDFKYGDQRTNHYFKMKYGLIYQLLHSNRMVFPKVEGELSYLSNKEFVAELPEHFSKVKSALFSR